MECLRDRIGLEGCGANTPASSLFINSLPGISLKNIESLSTEEANTAIEVWDKIQTRAIYRFASELRFHLAAKYKMNSAVASIDLGNNVDTTTTTAGVLNELRGVTFDFSRDASASYKRSDFLTHYIKEINFYSTGIVNGATFRVYDCLTGTVLWSKAQNLVSGWNTVNVGQTFTAEKIWVAILASTVTTISLPIDSNINGCDHCVPYVIGASGSSVSSLTESWDASGLSVVYSAVCKLDTIACNLSETFDVPLWYLLGSELMLERLTSDRVVKWTVNREQAKELKDYYDAEFYKLMKMAIDGLEINDNDICIECNQPVVIRQSPVIR